MKKILTSSVLFIIVNICTMAQDSQQQLSIPVYGDSLALEGEFVKHQFINKIGEPIENAYDLFFKISDDKKYFVKRLEGKFPKGKLEDNFNITFIVIASLNFGLWDADDNNTQSRVGDYIIIHEIKNKE